MEPTVAPTHTFIISRAANGRAPTVSLLARPKACGVPSRRCAEACRDTFCPLLAQASTTVDVYEPTIAALIVLDVQKRHALIVPGLLDFDASVRGCVVRGVSLEVSTLVAEPVASSTSRTADVARRSRFRCAIGPGVCSSRRPVPNYLSVSAFVLACPLATRPPSQIHARFPPMPLNPPTCTKLTACCLIGSRPTNDRRPGSRSL